MKKNKAPRVANASKKGRAVSVGSGALLGWFRVTEKLPPVGAIIACRAEHHTGRTMWWAGEIVEVWPQGFATMEVLEEHPRRFILTHDTEWCLLPNAEMTHDPKNGG